MDRDFWAVARYTTIDKAASLFGFVVQRADRIQLLGQFLDNAAFSPQVSRSIAYANTAIQAQPATSALFAALPSLLLANGASDPRGFARLTPEPYASVTQLGVDQTLTLVDTARGPGFAATDGDDVHDFTFGQAMGQWHRLSGNAGAGTSATQTHGYGLIGGIGIGNREWSIGAFGGYLDSRQRIDALDASNRTDGFVAGVHGRYAANGLQVSASALSTVAKRARGGRCPMTTRPLPAMICAAGSATCRSAMPSRQAGTGQ